MQLKFSASSNVQSIALVLMEQIQDGHLDGVRFITGGMDDFIKVWTIERLPQCQGRRMMY